METTLIPTPEPCITLNFKAKRLIRQWNSKAKMKGFVRTVILMIICVDYCKYYSQMLPEADQENSGKNFYYQNQYKDIINFFRDQCIFIWKKDKVREKCIFLDKMYQNNFIDFRSRFK